MRGFVILAILGAVGYGAYYAYLNPLTTTCREVEGDPIHLLPIVAPVVFEAFPKDRQTDDQRESIRLEIMTYCQLGADQTMRQIAEDIMQSTHR